MANRNFNRFQVLEHEVKRLYLETAYTALVQASGTLNLTDDIVLTKAAGGAANNSYTFTSEVLAAAANPTDTVLAAFTGTAAAIVCTVTPNNGTNNPASTPAVAATGTLDLTTDVVFTSVAAGASRNTTTFTLEVAAAAANPTDTILIDFTGTADAIVCTVTPNDGTNNSATPVNITTIQFKTYINNGGAGALNITTTDTLGLRTLQTATGGDTTVLANSGEGDGVVATFAAGADAILVPVSLTTAELAELINNGTVAGKTVTVTDASALRNDQTATGGGATALADGGEGDHVIATFAGGVDQAFTPVANQARWGIASVVESAPGTFRITLSDRYSAVKFLSGIVKASTAADFNVQIKAESVNASVPYIDIYTLTGATPTNPADGAVLKICIDVKNTDII